MIFFAIKGKKNDGNKFVKQSFERKASIAIVNSQKNLNHRRQIKVNDTLKFLTKTSKIYRKHQYKNNCYNRYCGKTTLKELWVIL